MLLVLQVFDNKVLYDLIMVQDKKSQYITKPVTIHPQFIIYDDYTPISLKTKCDNDSTKRNTSALNFMLLSIL